MSREPIWRYLDRLRECLAGVPEDEWPTLLAAKNTELAALLDELSQDELRMLNAALSGRMARERRELIRRAAHGDEDARVTLDRLLEQLARGQSVWKRRQE